MSEIFHVDTQFLRSALGVFERIDEFEKGAQSRDPARRAANVATLVDALDLCNLLVLGDCVVFDSDVGGGRQQKVLDQIDAVAASLGDEAAGQTFRDSFAGVAPADEATSWSLQLQAACGAAAFFPLLARCARNVLDLFHLPHDPPSAPERYLVPYLQSSRQPSQTEIDALLDETKITGRRFYAAMLSEPTAFRAMCDAAQRIPLSEEVLAVLFMNFRLRLAEQRSISAERMIVVGAANAGRTLTDTLVYLPSMGRRDFSREFTQFVRWRTDPHTRNEHAFDLGVRDFVVQEWEGIGCQVLLSERRAIPIAIASVLGSSGLQRNRRPQTLLVECLRWRRENQKQIAAIREATREFEEIGDQERKAKATAYVAEILRSSSTEAARNRDLADRMSVRNGWLGLGIRTALNPLGVLEKLVVDSTDKVREHFEKTQSKEYVAATHLSEAARPILAGVGSDIRQRMIDIFGGTVIDARNPMFDPDRFPAAA